MSESITNPGKTINEYISDAFDHIKNLKQGSFGAGVEPISDPSQIKELERLTECLVRIDAKANGRD